MQVKFVWNKQAKKKLESIDNIIMYEVARKTLDLSYQITPKNTGALRSSTQAYGIQENNGEYSIGSKIDYASKVYNLNDSRTNWTTPNTHSRWFGKVWKEQGVSIFKETVERNMLK